MLSNLQHTSGSLTNQLTMLNGITHAECCCCPGTAGEGRDESIPTLGRIVTGVYTWELESCKSHLFQLMPKQEPEMGSKVSWESPRKQTGLEAISSSWWKWNFSCCSSLRAVRDPQIPQNIRAWCKIVPASSFLNPSFRGFWEMRLSPILQE